MHLFMCVRVCMSHVSCVQYLGKLDECVGSARAGITGSCVSFGWYWNPNAGPLEEQYTLSFSLLLFKAGVAWGAGSIREVLANAGVRAERTVMKSR